MLPENLQQEYDSIIFDFNKIRDDWKKYNDEIIPEDKVFSKRIIKFVIAVLDYGIKNFSNVDVSKFQEFLVQFHYNFYYGPMGDDYNYLDFDEKVEGAYFIDLGYNNDLPLTKELLMKKKSAFEKLLEIF